MELQIAYIKHLELYLASKDSDSGLFRTLVDGWFAHKMGEGFVSVKGKQIWFNNPDPIKKRNALLRMHFISRDAMQVLNGEGYDNLVKDHSVPLKVLRVMMERLVKPSTIELQSFLEENYRLAVITKTEDKELDRLGLRSSIPDENNPISRYQKANIILSKK